MINNAANSIANFKQIRHSYFSAPLTVQAFCNQCRFPSRSRLIEITGGTFERCIAILIAFAQAGRLCKVSATLSSIKKLFICHIPFPFHKNYLAGEAGFEPTRGRALLTAFRGGAFHQFRHSPIWGGMPPLTAHSPRVPRVPMV